MNIKLRKAALSNLYVGSIVSIGESFFGSKPGTVGVIYGINDGAALVINSNGQFGAFTESCLDLFMVTVVGFANTLCSYQCKNTEQLIADFKNNLFGPAFTAGQQIL
tara:strand:+ start:491 stop:811 length:321 start_codon:yes stop_codon:yes gene_type:complete